MQPKQSFPLSSESATMSIIDIEDLQTHLNLPIESSDDFLLADKIAAAEAHIDSFLEIALGERDPVPEPLKEAVRQLAAHLYENREATLVGITAQELPFGVYDLIAPYRKWAF